MARRLNRQRGTRNVTRVAARWWSRTVFGTSSFDAVAMAGPPPPTPIYSSFALVTPPTRTSVVQMHCSSVSFRRPVALAEQRLRRPRLAPSASSSSASADSPDRSTLDFALPTRLCCPRATEGSLARSRELGTTCADAGRQAAPPIAFSANRTVATGVIGRCRCAGTAEIAEGSTVGAFAANRNETNQCRASRPRCSWRKQSRALAT